MADKSIVPLGTGVTIIDGLQPQLGLLLDGNQATYEIASGNGLHLLFIRADRAGPGSAGWTFSLQSLPVEDVANIFKNYTEGGENASPHWVDGDGYPVAMETYEGAYKIPAHTEVDPTDIPDVLTTSPTLLKTKSGAFESYTPLDLTYYAEVYALNKVTEVGTHIYPLAYHRIVQGNPPIAQIIQVARSDWHFWPSPTIPVWSRSPRLVSLTAGGCNPGGFDGGGGGDIVPNPFD